MTPLSAEELKSLTREDIHRFASSIQAPPIRSAGAEFINGQLHLKLGGQLVPDDVAAQGREAIARFLAKKNGNGHGTNGHGTNGNGNNGHGTNGKK